MTDCKNALVEADGDYDKAVEQLRIKGLKGVAKREGRAASNGLVIAKVERHQGHAARAQLRDRLRRQEREVPGAAAVRRRRRLRQQRRQRRRGRRPPLERRARRRERLHGREDRGPRGCDLRRRVRRALPAPHQPRPAAAARRARRAVRATNAEVAKDVAQHIAAFAPTYVSRDEVPEDVVAKEREIAEATAKEEGKPEAALPKIVEGRVNGFFKEQVLLEQAFAKDNKKTVRRCSRRPA
jgi:elongation factor Ts